MLCFTLLTRILGCPKSIGCRPGAYIYHNGENTQIGRIYGEDMMRITEQLQAEGSYSIQDVSKDRLTRGDMYCTWGNGLEKVEKLMDDLLRTAERNRQEHMKDIYFMAQSNAISSKTSTVRWLHKRRVFKALPGKYNCVSLLNRASLEVPPLKTNLPTLFSTLSSKEDFVIMSYRADFLMITLIGKSDLNILYRNVKSLTAFPSKKSMSTSNLATFIFKDFQNLRWALTLIKLKRNMGVYLTQKNIGAIDMKPYNTKYLPLKYVSMLPFWVGGEDHSLIGLLTDVVLSMLKDSWEFWKIKCNYLTWPQRTF